jgi:D-alanine-D-alanine ligase
MVDKDLRGIKIGVLGGGVSSEREISLISARNVYDVLRRNGLEAIFIDIATSEKEVVKKIVSSSNIDVAFIALHGEFGEDGRLQDILEGMDICYTGSSPSASYRAMNKIVSKKIFLHNNIPTAPFYIYNMGDELPQNIIYPIVVKPYFSGSSLGVFIVKTRAELMQAIKEISLYQDKIIIEDYIKGRELTVGILGERPLEVVEIIPHKDFFDFYTKYTEGVAEFVAPAQLKNEIYERVQNIALKAHQCLECRHFSRVDIRLSRDNTPYVLEVNSIPGLTLHSLFPLSARASGIDFYKLVLEMIILALNEKKQAQKI